MKKHKKFSFVFVGILLFGMTNLSYGMRERRREKSVWEIIFPCLSLGRALVRFADQTRRDIEARIEQLTEQAREEVTVFLRATQAVLECMIERHKAERRERAEAKKAKLIKRGVQEVKNDLATRIGYLQEPEKESVTINIITKQNIIVPRILLV